MPALPFKLNQDRRRHIPRQTHKVTNWPAYDASLRQRGSLTVWFSDEAVEAWAAEPRTTRGEQPWYSALAILTALTLRAVFRLAYRQAEGLIGSIVGLLGLALCVPDHTTLMWTARDKQRLILPKPLPAAGKIPGQLRPYVRPTARLMPLAIMGVRSRVRHQSQSRAQGAKSYAVLPGLS